MKEADPVGSSDLDVDDGDIVTGYASAPFDVEELESMLAGDPDNEMLLDIAAFKYYTSGDLVRAVMSYQRLVKLNYHKALYHFYLANSFYKLRRMMEARLEWDAVKMLDPDGQYGRKAEQRLLALRATYGS